MAILVLVVVLTLVIVLVAFVGSSSVVALEAILVVSSMPNPREFWSSLLC